MNRNLQLVITLIMACLFALPSTAQINFEGGDTYGRLRDVIYSRDVENRLYALTLGNHILRSDDHGLNWTIIYSYPENGAQLEGLAYNTNSTLSFSVKNASQLEDNTVYFFDLNTESVSQQIPQPNPGTSDNRWVIAYDVQPNDPNTIIMALGYSLSVTNYNKVYHSTNGGATWTEIYYNENFNQVYVNSVSIHPTDANKVYISRSSGPTDVDGGLLVSTDAGTNWTEKLPGIVLKPMAFNPNNPSEMLLGTASAFGGGDQALYRSLDAGNTWDAIPLTWTHIFDCCDDDFLTLKFNPHNPNIVAALDTNEIAISTDGGTTWTQHVYPANTDGQVNVDAYFYGLNISFNPFDSQDIVVTGDFYPFTSNDGGATFQKLNNPFFFTPMVGLSEVNSGHLYYNVQNGLVHKDLSTNTETAYDIMPLNIASINDPSRYYVDSQLEGRVYSFIGGFTGSVLYVSNDFGANAFPIFNVFLDQPLEVITDPHNANLVWASFQFTGSFKIDISDPMNPIPTMITLPSTGLHLATVIDANDANTVYINVGHQIYKSTDGGLNWQLKSNGITLAADDLIHDIQQNPSNAQEFSIATTQGIFKTTDAGDTWNQVYNGNKVHQIAYSESDNRIMASIFSSINTQAQILVSVNNGDVWTEIPLEAIAHSGSNSMTYSFQDGFVKAYIASYDLGLMSYIIDTNSLSLPEIIDHEGLISVYPNPASDVIHFKVPSTIQMDTITIYNELGQKVKTTKFTDQINISTLATGVYFIQLNSGKTTIIKRWIKS